MQRETPPPAVPLLDRHGNQLDVRITYEVGSGCVHTIALHAPYWVVNHTGLPIVIRELGALHGFSGDQVTPHGPHPNPRRMVHLSPNGPT